MRFRKISKRENFSLSYFEIPLVCVVEILHLGYGDKFRDESVWRANQANMENILYVNLKDVAVNMMNKT